MMANANSLADPHDVGGKKPILKFLRVKDTLNTGETKKIVALTPMSSLYPS